MSLCVCLCVYVSVYVCVCVFRCVYLCVCVLCMSQVWEAFPAERRGRTKTGGHSLLMGSSHLHLLVALLSSFYSDEIQRFIGDVKYSGIL